MTSLYPHTFKYILVISKHLDKALFKNGDTILGFGR